MSKRTYQKRKKIFMKSKKGLGRMSLAFSVLAFFLTYLAKYIYLQEPHAWYDITGRMDILLLGFAFVFSLVNFYIKGSIMFFYAYLGMGNLRWTLFSMFIPMGFVLFALFSNPSLYLIPVLSIILAHFYAHYKSQATQTV
ncbi:hypothetical protein [Paenibacillus polymyxa]|uniref:hypothetical protein n=1 Tax=Paenibacillus polymyxa TaxID=1406 RepID=UPI0003D339CF|nr:hypothetical protein [Paenibacillus polymyxa]AIW42393.1 hypothetical protein X809_41880 [Paenibacillus polymyxa CR1]